MCSWFATPVVQQITAIPCPMRALVKAPDGCKRQPSRTIRYAQAFRTRPVAELGRNCDKRQEARAGTNQTRALCSSMLAVGFPPLRMLYSGTQQIRSEEHTSELQSLMRISYAVFCLKKKNTTNKHTHDKSI